MILCFHNPFVKSPYFLGGLALGVELLDAVAAIDGVGIGGALTRGAAGDTVDSAGITAYAAHCRRKTEKSI